MARRPKLNAEMEQKIVERLRTGAFIDTAAQAAGVHRATLHRWMERGRKAKRGRYHDFLAAVTTAQAESEMRDNLYIAKAAVEDWRAAAWRLERRWPGRYGPRVQLLVQQEQEAFLDRLEKGLDPTTFRKVLELAYAEEPLDTKEQLSKGPKGEET